MDRVKLVKAIAACGEPAFRLKQVERAVFVRLISDWDQATDLPAGLRAHLKENVSFSSVEEVERSSSARGDTSKVALQLEDGLNIEAVLMRHEDGRNTVCVSSQAGCPMRCAFCATGKQGFRRNLTSSEITDQVLHFARELNRSGARVSNVVFMGMGEPFHNYDEVMDAIRRMNAADGLGIGARHISVSTCGIVPGIKRLADEPLQLNLAISLHAPSDALRDRLMPVNGAYPLGELMKAIEGYVERTNRKVMFEYLLLDGVNDSLAHADELAELMRGSHLYHVNLIRFHRTGDFRATPRERRDEFLERLRSRGVSATHRVSFGEDIKAACGMLAGK